MGKEEKKGSSRMGSSTRTTGKEDQKRRKNRITRLATMLIAIVVFCVVELVIGHLAHSLALVADSFHMMSDALSLIIAAVAIRMGGKINKEKNTFGWLRAEILGAVINGVFLLALCLTITLHAFERVVTPEPIENPLMVLIVGTIGFLVNVFGMLLFHDHSHSHSHDHSHSHSHDHSHSHHSHRDCDSAPAQQQQEGEHLHQNGTLVTDQKANRKTSLQVTGPKVSYDDHGGLRATSGSISDMSSIRRKINFVVHEELCKISDIDLITIESGSSDDLGNSNPDTECELCEVHVGENVVEESENNENGENDVAGGTSTKTMQSGGGQCGQDEDNNCGGKETPKTNHDVAKQLLKRKEELHYDAPCEHDQLLNGKDKEQESNNRKHSSQFEHEHNMRAVFLHILSDLFASVLVMITASAYILMERYGGNYGGAEATWLLYIDPILSIVIVVIIIVPTYRLIREASEILLNNAPSEISPHQFAKELFQHIPEIVSVHDLYLWPLTANILVATVHVVIKSNTLSDNGANHDSESEEGALEPTNHNSQVQAANNNSEHFEQKLMNISKKLNKFFHDRGVHTTTIQLEFTESCNNTPRSLPRSSSSFSSPTFPNVLNAETECSLKCGCEKSVCGVSNKPSKKSKTELIHFQYT